MMIRETIMRPEIGASTQSGTRGAVPMARSTPRHRGFVMVTLLLAALCAFLVLAMVADMQILAHVQNRAFKQNIQKRIAEKHVVLIREPAGTTRGEASE